MAIATNNDLIALIRRHRLLEFPQLAELQSVASQVPDPRALGLQLLLHNWLTPYQVNQLFMDRAADLTIGQYLLLERLGKGAMGQVYKVRHRLLHWVAALKVIHKPYVSNRDLVRRFCHEIQAMARLSHPNVVYEFDAGQVEETYYIVMEYVEGVDLSRLVRERGRPLPWPRAVDFINQAAQGLQHAHERGLIHRDVKPSNLLLTQSKTTNGDAAGKAASWSLPAPGNRGPTGTDVVKIFDLGLSRLLAPPDSDDGSPTLTRANVFIGTPDYVAPEQAQSPHSADIRSDLYSLGCTFYFLLAGRPPFPGGSPLDKLINHCQGEPVPIERLRPDVPFELAAVVRKLMAKKPVDRYQSPNKLVRALAPLLAQAQTLNDVDKIPMAEPVENPEPEPASDKFFADCFNTEPPDSKIIKLTPSYLTDFKKNSAWTRMRLS